VKTIREFQHKLIEVSQDQIGIVLPKLWNPEVQFWSSILKTIGITEKSDMKLGKKCDPLLKEIFECRPLENSNTNS